MAWTGYIDRLHSNDPEWHFSVDSICLDTKGKVALLLNAMHDINK
jgi:sulfur transfer protein SufE